MRKKEYTISIGGTNYSELFFSLLFILPYFEYFLGGTWRIGDSAVGRSIIVVECVIIIVNLFHNNILKKTGILKHGYELLFCGYIFAVLLLNTTVGAVNISTALWMGVPLFCAMTLHSRLLIDKMDYNKIIYYGTFLFTTYSIALVFYNIIALGFFHSGNRLTALAGGPVVFGYTLAVFFAFVITNKQCFSYAQELFLKLTFTSIAILTGSRGGVWPILLLWTLDFIRTKFSYKKTIIIGVLALLFILVNPIDYIYNYMPRLFQGSDSSRLISTLSAIRAYEAMDFSQAIIGCGPGDCFPYQTWVNENLALGTAAGNSNNFVFNGETMLVQPHNAMIYFLLELGLMGVIGLVVLLVKNAHLLTNNNCFNRVVLIATIVGVNMFDSILVVEPGVALVMWFMILACSSQQLKI